MTNLQIKHKEQAEIERQKLEFFAKDGHITEIESDVSAEPVYRVREPREHKVSA